MKDNKKDFFVYHERGGYIHVIAKDKEDAVEEFYNALHSIMGHQLKICDCYGESKPIDRDKVVRITKIVEGNTRS